MREGPQAVLYTACFSTFFPQHFMCVGLLTLQPSEHTRLQVGNGLPGGSCETNPWLLLLLLLLLLLYPSVVVPPPIATFKRSQLGTTRSYEGLAEHGKRYIPKLAGRRVPNAFGRLLKKKKIFQALKGGGRPSQQGGRGDVPASSGAEQH